MRFFSRHHMRRPLWTLSALWPTTMIVPLAPLLSRIFVGTLTWQQELWIALLLSSTLLVSLTRLSRDQKWFIMRPVRAEFISRIALGLFVVWSAASLSWAASPLHTLHYVLTWSVFLLFFSSMRRAVSQPRLLRASLIALATVIWMLAVPGMIEFWSTPAFLFRYSIGLGEPTATVIPLFAALALHVRRRREALFCGATATVAWLTTLQTLERSPLIGACIALVLMALMMSTVRRFHPHKSRRALLLFFALTFTTATQIALTKYFQASTPTIITRLQTPELTGANSSIRLLFWATGLEMLREHPLLGIGAGNYEVAFADARREFVARYPQSSLAGVAEEISPQRAHNEYVQMLAELGIIGFVLFLTFVACLMWCAWRALNRSRQPLLALGAFGSLLTFAISSSASSISFRWMGSGLLFFFAAAIIMRCATDTSSIEQTENHLLAVASPARLRLATTCAFALSLVLLAAFGLHAVSSTLHGAAQWSKSVDETERLYRASLRLNPYDPVTHYFYGLFLLSGGRTAEAVPQLRYASERGFNSSVCYGYVAAAEKRSGDTASAEQTLARAVAAYPRSIFLLANHSAALESLGHAPESAREFARAVSIDERAARGWQQLIDYGLSAATGAAHQDRRIALPGELRPEICIYTVLDDRDHPAGFDTIGDRLYVRAVKQQ